MSHIAEISGDVLQTRQLISPRTARTFSRPMPEGGVDQLRNDDSQATMQAASELSDETLIEVLFNEARATSTTELWLTTLGGAIDAALLQWQHPSLAWLAAGCGAIAAYGAWGLLDRVVRSPGEAPPTRGFRVHLIALRDFVARAGAGAVAYAVFRFMAGALSNWNH